MPSLLRVINDMGGKVTHELGIINAVGAELTVKQEAELAASGLRLYPAQSVQTAGQPQPDTIYPALVGADVLHVQGITGEGVTVAVIDTGLATSNGLDRKADGDYRGIVLYDAIINEVVYNLPDESGHGTHVSSIIISSNRTKKPYKYNGVAPDAGFVSVKAFNGEGAGQLFGRHSRH